MSTSGVWRRGAIYQYRTRVPADLVALMGTSRINRSLKTASLTVARRLVKTMAFEIEQQFDAVRAGCGARSGPVASKLSMLGWKLAPEMTFGLACERYLTDPTISRSPKSQIVYRSTLTTLITILSSDIPLAAITRDACREVLGVLQRLPPNARKRWPDLSPAEAADEARQLGIPPMSLANCNEYMNKFSSFLNWAVREEMLDRNPARGLRVVEPLSAREKRLPFANWQLQRIFDAPLYRGCRDDENGYSTVGPNRPRRSRFWIPLVALWSGLRQGEICQMLVDDVREIDGVLCFVVSAGGDDCKRLKTAASRRLVPVHPKLQEIGFASYVMERRRAHDARLFADLTKDSLGLYSGNFSKWFSRFLVTCDAARERTCFHGFRHSFRDALREARIERDIALTLGGWTTTSGNGAGAVADSYGRGYSSRILYDALAQISYSELDLSHLYFSS